MSTTNGTVEAIAQKGNVIYLGGQFSYVGPNTGGGAEINLNEGGLVKKPLLKIDGKVHIAIPDGRGGWYIGGVFTHVQGVSRHGLAHILPDGFLNKNWNPNPDQGASINALAISGNTVYVGGQFTSIGGQNRSNLAAVDAATALATAWMPEADSIVNAIILSSNTVYAGGSFSFIGGEIRNNLAALDPVTGLATSWNPDTNGQVITLAISGNTVYVGGQFTSIGGQSRSNLAAVDAATALVLPWKPDVAGSILDIDILQNTIYVAGRFFVISGQTRNGAAAIDAATGLITTWNPAVVGSVRSLAISANTVYLGGSFVNVGGHTIRRNLVAVDATTGSAIPSDTDANNLIESLTLSGNALFVGGEFTSAGGRVRNNLVAIDATSGQPLSWNPNLDVNGYVYAIAISENILYVGGRFTSVNGQERNGLAAIDATTGMPTSWHLDVKDRDYTGTIYTLVLSENTLFVGGYFNIFGGQSRRGLAAVNTITGQLTSWNPTASNTHAEVNTIVAITCTGNTVYVGGSFNRMGIYTRNHLAAIDAVTGQISSWNPDVGGATTDWGVHTLAYSNNIVYVGGGFSTIGGKSRNALAAIDATTGQPTSWNPILEREQYSPEVYDLSFSKNMIYVGGNFSTINGQKRSSLASIDVISGQPAYWNPDLRGYVFSMVIGGNNLYVGGSLKNIVGTNITFYGFAGFKISQPQQFVKGAIYEDVNGNCVKETAEKGIPGMVVVAQPGNYFTSTDSLGNYTLAVDTGRYTIEQVIPQDKASLIKQICPTDPPIYQVHVTENQSTISGIDFANQLQYKSLLSVDVSSDRRRRCMSSTTTVTYQNAGNKEAENVKVYIQLPEYVALISASIPYTQEKENTYLFNLGTLAANHYGSIYIKDSVVCNNPSIRGLTQCTKAWITPANTIELSPEWDGSDLTLKAKCLENGRVRVAILNNGHSSMTDSTSFRLFLDATLAFTYKFKLAKGDSLILQVPANGQTLRLEADQRPGHPSKQQTNITIEACGTNTEGKVSLGYVDQLPQDDAEPEVAINCLPIIDSYDPNDKLVSPGGVTEYHYTCTNTPLNYKIRFQNTGTDIAYKVVVVDTLSEHLDISTLKMGIVSHPYKLSVSGKGQPVLTFTFDNIFLPDSNSNEQKSHGYISLSIKPKKGLAEKTKVGNYADIFFDYNEPVRTNTTVNAIYDIPAVVIEEAKITEQVICHRTNMSVDAGANRVICQKDTVVLQGAAPVYGKGRWKVIKGSGQIKDKENSYTLVKDVAYGENTFEWSIAANTCGTDSLIASVTIFRVEQPATPIISQLGADSLTCNLQASAYEWLVDGHTLQEHTQTIKVSQSGSYSVRIKGTEGCSSAWSLPFIYVPTGISPDLAAQVSIHPNPSNGHFLLSLPADLGNQVQITITDALGRKVFEQTLIHSKMSKYTKELDLSSQVPGIYVVKLYCEKGMILKKVLKR
ncbi:PQQ-binding-like beta-propeller repeat protein [Rhodocytophaga aerolata]|uniref:PQQ-binding-like beta-propeller repeat protein n=1 Tax=Rhodocytophaga aerolata TaxID=455078 RepID=A0ABT8RJ41_9BACT|nr:T9SS type A sorting domain-containing protein [Rhodocytophaga aerolata]MDO1451228.1 PQQ-binding-like beta-propeller repeat protein [Rhodocytophaga aerolata]